MSRIEDRRKLAALIAEKAQIRKQIETNTTNASLYASTVQNPAGVPRVEKAPENVEVVSAQFAPTQADANNFGYTPDVQGLEDVVDTLEAPEPEEEHTYDGEELTSADIEQGQEITPDYQPEEIAPSLVDEEPEFINTSFNADTSGQVG